MRPPRLSLACGTLLAALLLSACGGAADEAADGAAAPDATAADGAAGDASAGDGGDGAAPTPALPADLADVSTYELTMDRVDRYFAASQNVMQAVDAMSPAERATLRGEDGGASGSESLDQMAQRIESNRAMRGAIEEAGLSAREYAVLTLAITSSMMLQAMTALQPNADPDSLARAANVNPQNVAFMREHAEEIGRRMQEMQEPAPQEAD
jgi:hypothetical protein